MKVMMDGERVTEIGKMLHLEAVDAEAMGFYLIKGEGGPKFVEVIERMMHDPSGLKHWYPTAVGVLAKSTPVHSWSFDEHEWCEVDFPADLQFARQIVARW
ncbi:MAG: nucleotidyltransferase, partial [Hyphomicrobiales bacterium]